MSEVSKSASANSTEAEARSSPWSPFRHTTFTVLWIATVLSNIGTWMQNAGAGWLMTALKPDPFEVAFVQAAGTLPMFLFGLPAGALADIVDRRRLMIATQILATVLAALFTVSLWVNWATPDWLLAFLFLSGIAAILAAPAWQAIVPDLVPREALAPAMTPNGVGFNISRAIGPALAGGHHRPRHRGAILAQRRQQSRRYRGVGLVARREDSRTALARRAPSGRDAQRFALCPL